MTDRIVATEFKPPKRASLSPGDEFKVQGMRGRFKFKCAVTNAKGTTWVDCFDEGGRYRSISPEQITVVHRDRKMRPPR